MPIRIIRFPGKPDTSHTNPKRKRGEELRLVLSSLAPHTNPKRKRGEEWRVSLSSLALRVSVVWGWKPYAAVTLLWLAAAATAMGQVDTFSRDGLVMSWDVSRSPERANDRQLTDHSGQDNHASFQGNVTSVNDPAAIEFDGRSAAVAQRSIRPERLTLETAFRVDATRGPLQLVFTTHPPKLRKGGEIVPGNSRQWFLQLRGEPPAQDGYLGFLEFGIFGEDARWHSLMSQTRIAKGWHHALGTFDGRRVRFFLDGVEQTRTRSNRSGEYQGRINRPPDSLVNLPAVGTNSPRNPNGLMGAVALARLYDRALSDQEIQGNFAHAKTIVPDLANQTAAATPVKPPFKVLYSNDFTNTHIVAPWHERGEPFHPDHLRSTVREARGVSVHMLQPAHGAVPWWPSRVYTLDEHHAWWAENFGIDPKKLRYPGVHQYILDGGDPFRDFIDQCRDVDQTPFISLRLNDVHHLHHAQTPRNTRGIHSISRFYVEHPEWWLGAVGSGLDWSVPEVRRHMFALIEEICGSYDLAGFELDFMRFPNFFKQDVHVEERTQIITRFVADVRALLDRTAEPGRHRWLSARVPCLLQMHPEIGIDLPSIVDAGVDIINLSASFFTFQAHDVAKVRRLVPDVAVYLEMCHCTMTGERLTTTGGDNFLFMRTTDQQFYTTAHVAYRRGVDGISLFNFVYYRDHGVPGRGPFNEPPFHVLEHLGDPDWLSRQPQWYFWAQNGFTKTAGQEPIRFEKGDAETFEMDMAPTEHQSTDGFFRLMTAEDTSKCQWMVKLNGATLEPTDYIHKPLDHPYESGTGQPNEYACFKCPRSLVRGGINKVALILENGPPVTVRYWDLVLP